MTTFYRWEVRFRTGQGISGGVDTPRQAQDIIKHVIQFYKAQGREPLSQTIWNQDDVRIMSIEYDQENSNV